MNREAVKVSYKSKDFKKNIYIFNSNFWDDLVHRIMQELHLKTVEIEKMRKYWIGKTFSFLLC